MAARVRWYVAVLGAVLLAHAAVAQDQQPEVTPAGKAALQSMLAGDGRSSQTMFPQATCVFRGGLCGAVRRDLTVAVPPRYDWVGRFFEGEPPFVSAASTVSLTRMGARSSSPSRRA